jgi:type II secretion system protein J
MRRVVAPSGLTLIEVMVVLVVSSLLLGGAWQLFHSSMHAYQRGLQDVRLAQGARAVLTMMTRDLQRAFAAALPHGIQGANDHDVSAAGAVEVDRLELITVPSERTSTAQGQATGMGTAQRVRYFLAPVAAMGPLVLQRAVAAADGSTTARLIPLDERLRELHLRYFDGQTWYDEWQHPALPHALEIVMVFQHRGRHARPYRFTTVVPLY